MAAGVSLPLWQGSWAAGSLPIPLDMQWAPGVLCKASPCLLVQNTTVFTDQLKNKERMRAPPNWPVCVCWGGLPLLTTAVYCALLLLFFFFPPILNTIMRDPKMRTLEYSGSEVIRKKKWRNGFLSGRRSQVRHPREKAWNLPLMKTSVVLAIGEAPVSGS